MIHARLFQGHVQNRVIAAPFRDRQTFALNAVQAGRQRRLDFFIRSDFRFIGRFTNLRVRAVGEVQNDR